MLFERTRRSPGLRSLVQISIAHKGQKSVWSFTTYKFRLLPGLQIYIQFSRYSSSTAVAMGSGARRTVVPVQVQIECGSMYSSRSMPLRSRHVRGKPERAGQDAVHVECRQRNKEQRR